MEQRIDRWLATAAAVVGGISLLGGVAYALDAAWTAGWVGPAHAAAMALMLGTAALIAGDRMWSGRWRTTAAGLSGAGMGVLYLTLFLSYDHFGWLSGPVASVLLLGVTTVGGVQAVRRDSQLMACLGLVGGLLTPVLLGGLAAPTAPYQLWLVLLDVAVVATLAHRRWPVLAWLAVAGTAAAWVVGIGWGASTVPVVVGAGLVGSAFGVGALRQQDAHLAGAQLVGVAIAMIATLGTLPFVPWLALLTMGLLSSLAQVATARHGWHTASRGLGIGSAFALAVIGGATALVVPGADPTMLLAMAGLPAAMLWATHASGHAPDGGEVLPMGMAAAVIGVCATVSSGQLELLPWLGLLLGVGGIGASTTLAEGRLQARSELRIVAPLGLLAGSACAAMGAGAAALPIAATLALLTLALPAWLPADEGIRRWTPMVAFPVALAAFHLQWAELAPALGAVPVLGLGAATLWLQRQVRHDETAHRVYQGLTVALAVLAVPVQLQREAWTIGWALLAAALAWAGRQDGSPSRAFQGVALALVAAVTVRLIANPAVLGYHLADGTPVGWVLYGYGVPLAALVGVERWTVRGRPAVQAAMAGIAFAGLNLAISHVFSHGGVVELVDLSLHARVARTVGWAASGLGLLALGHRRLVLRHLGLALLAGVVAKVALSDLWVLPDGLARAALLGGVAVAFLAAAGVLQRRPRAAAAA